MPDDTHAVGSHAANGYGLHDMAGYVWVRGGAWSGTPNYLRVAYRGNYSPALRDNLIGLRCAR